MLVRDGEGTIEVNERHLCWVRQIEDDVFWLEVSMNVPNTMQLLKSSNNLKHDPSQLFEVTMLIKVRS
jgi:hypothetical protein